jgi:hypothetical protein
MSQSARTCHVEISALKAAVSKNTVMEEEETNWEEQETNEKKYLVRF